MTLHHYTCPHGARGITQTGLVVPIHHLLPPEKLALAPAGHLAWFTDLDPPIPAALGFTIPSGHGCDRTTHRFTVTDDTQIVPWLEHPLRRTPLGGALMSAPGALVRHWFVSEAPVPVTASPTRPACRICRLPEIEHRDRNGHRFVRPGGTS